MVNQVHQVRQEIKDLQDLTVSLDLEEQLVLKDRLDNRVHLVKEVRQDQLVNLGPLAIQAKLDQKEK